MRKAACRAYAIVLLIVGSLIGLPAGTAVAAPAGRIAADPIAHDPTIIKQGRYYYAFITGDIATRTYLPMKRSTDLLHWEELGPVFTTPPAWIVAALGTTPGDFWAPDISYFNGEYRLYYAASSFGTNNSVIGLATNRTLDPRSPLYRWTDRGLVLKSEMSDNFNAIDPDVVADRAGQQWLAFGSFWDGIKMRRLDNRTGGLSADDPATYSLASRGGASIEGASIVRRGGYYYLFVSLDYCCRGIDSDYRVVVGRATAVTGPYVDRGGVPMLTGGGTEILRGYNEFRGPGGGDVYGDLFVHHYYDLDDNGLPKLSVRVLAWRDGWPAVGDPLSGSRAIGRGPAYETLVSRVDGSVIANSGCGYEGADIRLEAPTGSPCQQWRPDDRGDGYVSLGNRFSNKVAEVAACVNADGARVAQWGWLHNDCQLFALDPGADGWLTIRSRLNGRVLQPAACSGDGAPIQTFTLAGTPCQQFRLKPVGDVLITDPGEARALNGCTHPAAGDLPREASTTSPRFAELRPGPCQRWHFEHVADGYYRVINRATGRALNTTDYRIEPAGLRTRDGDLLPSHLKQ